MKIEEDSIFIMLDVGFAWIMFNHSSTFDQLGEITNMFTIDPHSIEYRNGNARNCSEVLNLMSKYVVIRSGDRTFY